MSNFLNAPFFVRLAICYPLGLLPAPGTWGSIPGLFLGLLIYYFLQILDFNVYLEWGISISILIGLSFYALRIIDKTEKYLNSHDDKRIVIDEVVGQAIPASFISFDPLSILVCFGLFRFFDILKPGPIGTIDKKWPGAYGTLFDDVFAGLMVLLIVIIDRLYFNLIFASL